MSPARSRPGPRSPATVCWITGAESARASVRPSSRSIFVNGLRSPGSDSNVDRWLDIVPDAIEAPSPELAHLTLADGSAPPGNSWAFVFAATGEERRGLRGVDAEPRGPQPFVGRTQPLLGRRRVPVEQVDPRGENGNGADSGLVETPESQSAPADTPSEAAPKKAPARKPRTRKPAPKAEDAAPAGDGGDAEAKPAPKKTTRSRAKPKPKTEDGPAEAAE